MGDTMNTKLGLGLIPLIFAGAALATPPSHAPAHGWRAKNDPYYAGYSGRHYREDFGILSGRCNRDAIGAVLGGVGGAVIGGQVAGRDDRVVGMVVGGVLGAVVGHAIGEELDKNDRGCMGHALELGKAGVPVVWSHDGHRYHFTPRGEAPNNCRYATLVMDNRKPREILACPNRNGEWKFNRR
jgi:surface antigen